MLARRSGDRRQAREITFGAVDIGAILGDYDSAIQRYVDAMSARWADSWTDSMMMALEGTGYDDVGTLDIRPRDYDPLVVDSRLVVDYDRETVRAVVAGGMDEGLSPRAIADRIRESEPFGALRAQRISRTETLRSQESGYDRRIARALANGAPIIGSEWMSDALAAKWKRRHDLLDGVRVGVGVQFTYPTSGVKTDGPGLSGDPGEDVHCRCARRTVLAPR